MSKIAGHHTAQYKSGWLEAVNAFKVLVLTVPADPTLSIMYITASSFGASIIIPTAYCPKV
ncbi:MAG: hypothetical protein WBZ36_19180 [Candidatus Nitrosopolaris sp.]|jgi:hypothetical protein